MCYCPTPTLHLNLALTGDGAFLFSLKKTHSVWFISVLNYGDTENVLINHLLLVIPMSYNVMLYYVMSNLCPHKPHKHAHTHTHTHTPEWMQGAVKHRSTFLIIMLENWVSAVPHRSRRASHKKKTHYTNVTINQPTFGYDTPTFTIQKCISLSVKYESSATCWLKGRITSSKTTVHRTIWHKYVLAHLHCKKGQ